MKITETEGHTHLRRQEGIVEVMGAAYKDEQLQWKIHATVQNNHRISPANVAAVMW